ncbi:hypothetical protein JDBV08_00570 [Mycobacterium phage jiawei]|uniref:hypothetical protein n=1 Tax=Brevundimonas diminuta TaxID=293 RepID=UPI001902F345|nr:hypothetical protein [Brevundimonas diminuta]MBK1968406.1 hypothetical protein [Brevundimonas diminuta]WRQ08281.1 hypothetical protein JDBV08_00570 [Mycobacterium phage jiawei]
MAKSFPSTIRELLDELDKWYPEHLADPADSIATIMHRAGARGVVRDLRRRFEAAQKREP